MDSKIEGNFFHNETALLSKQNMSMISERDQLKKNHVFRHTKTVSNNLRDLKNFDKNYLRSNDLKISSSSTYRSQNKN